MCYATSYAQGLFELLRTWYEVVFVAMPYFAYVFTAVRMNGMSTLIHDFFVS